MKINRLFLLPLLFCTWLFIDNINAQCDSQDGHPDFAALMALYESTNGMFWLNNQGWRQGANGESCDPCNHDGAPWFGVHCENNRVARLDFDGIDDGSYNTNREGNNLNGPLPDNFGQLTELELVLFDFNDLNGSIPPSIGQLQKLKNFSAIENSFSGEIPDEIYDLASLTLLCFRDNQLTGTISPLIAKLQELYLLCFDGNDLSGEIPAEIGALPKLGVLWLARNDFEGVVPSTFKNLNRLDRFSLGPGLEGNVEDFIPENDVMNYIFIIGTDITGDINFFCNLPNLQTLSISYNELYGTIGTCFLEHPSLNRFLAVDNNLEGCYPEMDITLCDLDLESINFSDNPGLPWGGNFQQYCNEQQQRGAPCTLANGNEGQIGSDCNCDIPKSCSASYEINSNFSFRGLRCLSQPSYPGMIKDSEAIIIRNPVPSRKYIFDMCEEYDENLFEANIVMVEYDSQSSTEGEVLYEGQGCRHEIKIPEELAYDDVLIIVTDKNDCTYASKGIENGVPVLKCAIGRN